MSLSLEELIRELQAQLTPNIPHQRTNVTSVERDGMGVKIVTDEMNAGD